jgi:hypothetical protein
LIDVFRILVQRGKRSDQACLNFFPCINAFKYFMISAFALSIILLP